MLDPDVDRFMQTLARYERHEEKVMAGLRGFFRFFPFKRLFLFSFSPINFVGEGLFLLDADGNIYSMEHIKQDVRNIPPIYEAIRNKRADFVDIRKDEGMNITALIVVPLWIGPLVLGCVLIDEYCGEGQINELLVESIDEYFRLGVHTIAADYFDEEGKRLSKREIEVLEWLSNGWSTKEMAYMMGISEFTARDYISSAMKKLGAKHRAQAIAEAMRMGLIS